MRPTSKISLCFLVSCVGLLFVFSNSVWTQEAKKANSRIKELQQQRLVVLEQVHDTAKQLFQNARIQFESVHGAAAELFAARLEYAETQEDRIKACDDAVKAATECYEVVLAQKQASRGSEFAVLKAKAFVLEVQIAREKAETHK